MAIRVSRVSCFALVARESHQAISATSAPSCIHDTDGIATTSSLTSDETGSRQNVALWVRTLN
eukprot:scaffold457411_cov17-Prasinocladus_malaysianus.AAC.2